MTLDDLVHLASAINGQANVFLSTDYDLLKKGRKYESILNLKFFNPSDFIYMEK
ncbi:MAG TPA: hypothetical protein PK079_13980 [Leptospiraceae bacterium]|nr:hypothetical protein [Leptospiraceae bacterium]HMW08505.1 hypothetical protein [Leptospiraceae bacterium]HMX33345.1 hypothetical protein [Leptospiraceae bacterium]HMY34090.1 hypothetical protein [Leptospiraceae bacterium]HMZ64607.1 hypothetical protein [Leptospiraceae bacterium]